MSWEVQGRQGHGWFGTGTGGGADGVDVVGAVVREAGGLLPVARRGAFGRYLAAGGLEELREAIPVWGGASGLDGGSFRRLVVGPVLGGEAAASLQALGVAFAAGDVGEAGARLAGAVGSERSGAWARGLGYARDQAVYSAVNGRVAGGSGQRDRAADLIEARQTGSRGMPGLPALPGPLAPFVPGTPENEANTRRLQPLAQGVVDWLRGVFHVESDGEGGNPAPFISPSAGTGTPSPDEEPENDEDAKSDKKDQVIPEIERKSGISRQEVRDLAGFHRNPKSSAEASTEAPAETVTRLKARGVTREMVQAYKDFYDQTVANAVRAGKVNLSAEHRALLLGNILRRY